MIFRFNVFTFFGFLTSKMTFKFKFGLIRPTKSGGAQSFCLHDFYCQGALYASKFHFEYILRPFCALDHLSLGFFILFQIFCLSAFISMPQVFKQSLFLLFSFLFAMQILDWNQKRLFLWQKITHQFQLLILFFQLI